MGLQRGPFHPTKAAKETGSFSASQTAEGRIIDGPWFEEAKALVFVFTLEEEYHTTLY
jgi:hypothetical protein